MIVFRWGATHTNNGVRAPCIYACLQGFSMQTRTSWGLASLCKHLNATCAIVGCPTSCLYPCRVTEQRLYRKLCIMCVCVCVCESTTSCFVCWTWALDVGLMFWTLGFGLECQILALRIVGLAAGTARVYAFCLWGDCDAGGATTWIPTCMHAINGLRQPEQQRSNVNVVEVKLPNPLMSVEVK